MGWIAYKNTITWDKDTDKETTTKWYYTEDGWNHIRGLAKEFDTEQEALDVDDSDGAEEM